MTALTIAPDDPGPKKRSKKGGNRFDPPVRSVNSRPTHKLIAIDDLTIDIRVQKESVSSANVNFIADHLDFSKLGTLTVSLRADGTIVILDGQHRWQALKKRGLGTYKIQCAVYEGLTLQQEGDLFIGLARRSAIRPFDKFRVGVTAKHEECLGVTEVCGKHAWRITAGGGKNGTTSCVQSLVRIWLQDKSGVLLNRVVVALTQAFGRDGNTLNGHVVDGMAKFLLAHGDVDAKKLTDKLQASCSSPTQLITRARTRRETENGSLAANVCAVIERIYDSRKSRG